MDLNEIQPSESITNLHHIESIESINEPRQYTFLEKTKLVARLITIEPLLFLYLFATIIAGGALSNMMFEMGCRVDLHLNDTLCTNIAVGIKHVAVLLGNSDAWNRPVQQTVSMIMVIYFATFSDRHNIRKPFFIIPMLGEVFSCSGLILCAAFISQWPVEIYFVMALIVPAFFGGAQTVLMAVYSYITDISTQEERTFRIGIVQVVSLFITPIGFDLGGILFLKVGYYGVYSISLVIFLAALLYGQFFIKEKPSEKRDINLCADVFDIKSVAVNMFKILIQKRVAYRRFLLIMSYVCYILIRGPNAAEGLYIKNYAINAFHWNIDTYGYLRAFDTIVHIIGMFIGMTLFTKAMKLNDYAVAVISCIMKIIVDIIWYVFSGTNVITFCIGFILNLFSGLFMIALRSVTTKLVNPSEIAKAQALFAICEVLCPIIYNNMYAKFFAARQDVFLLSTVLMVIPTFILFGMYLLYKHDLEHAQPELQNGHQNEMEEYTNDIEIEKFECK